MEFKVSLAFLLILFLVILIADLLCSAAAALFGRSFSRVFLYGLFGLLIPLFLFGWGYFVGRNRYSINKIKIVSERVPSGFEGYKIVQISDIHLRSFAHRKRQLAKIVAAVDSLKPDVIMFTGDLVTADSREIRGFEKILSSLHAPEGVISILGNHDYCFYGKFASEEDRLESLSNVINSERRMGFRLLLNENYSILRGEDSISVIGVENISASRYFKSYGDLRKAMKGTADGFKILLTHDPSHWDNEVAGNYDIDLTLSGHTHAMQFSLFGWCPSRYIFKSYRGLYKYPVGKANAADGGILQYLYVNIGLGETALPIRVGTPPEITLITLSSSESGQTVLPG
ncbi:MAG: metallophosphoesterase [Bacteroidales bacterium]|jgi:predicted MPP superfamily phosphohydrolase|nr:metallophosphoesterase [Bacteroidales bacterium]